MKKHKVDLHVHSPASIDYQGGSGPKAFTDLLSAYVDQEVDVIALTDHNTVNGYLDLKRQREEARQMYQVMLEREEHSDFLDRLSTEIEHQSKVFVIPGVEISVYPGIHIILLFDETIIHKVNDFLRDSLKLGEAVKKGDPAKVSEFSAVTVLDRAVEEFSDSFFCILPHIESSKGAWEELSGQVRAELFKHNSVVAVQIINPATRSHVEQALKSNEYKRKNTLKFIQASDYHGSPSVQPAQQFSIINAPTPFNWKGLVSAFSEESNIRLSCEFVEERLENFLRERKVLKVEFQNTLEMVPEFKADLVCSLAAILNTPHSALQINLLNIKETNNLGTTAIADLIKELTKELDPPESFEFGITQFHHSNTRQRFCVETSINSRIRLYDNTSWTVGDDGAKRPAKSWEIERQVSQNFYTRFGKPKQRAMVRASNKILMMSNSFPAFSIATRLERLLTVDRLLTKEPVPGFEATIEKTKFFQEYAKKTTIGFDSGDYYLLQRNEDLKGGRLGDQQDYYRFSTPLFRYSGEEKRETYLLKEPSVILSVEGSVTFAAKGLPLYSFAPCLIITCKESDDEEIRERRLLGLTAFLKSSFILWYAVAIHQTNDIFDFIFRRLPLPLPRDPSDLHKLSNHARNILVSERKLLQQIEKKFPAKKDDQHRMKLIEKHNHSAQTNLHLIDRDVFRQLEFSKEEIEEVFRVLREMDLYDYGLSPKKLDDFLEDFVDTNVAS